MYGRIGCNGVTVNSLPAATITPGGPTSFCTGDSLILSANTESDYLWSTTAATQSITVKQNGSYTVTVTDANGCTAASPPVTVTVNTTLVPSISITATPSGPVCAGASITFHSTSTGQGNSPVYEWLVNGVNTGITGDTASTTQLQNNDIVTCLLTSSAGCANPDTALSNAITVTVTPIATPAISIAATLTAVCQGSADTIAATVTNGGNTPVYIWLLNSQPINNTGSSYISDSLNTTDVVTCVLISSAACASPDTVTSSNASVTVYQAPAAGITPSGNVSVCQGDSVELSAGAGNTGYVWNTHAITQNIYVQFGGTYTVTVTNVNNCTAVSPPVNVTVNPLPAVPTITQSGDTLTSSAASFYQWYLNDTLISGATGRQLVVSRNGTYTVQVSDTNACSNTSAGLNVTALAINDVAVGFDVQLYPNPSNGNFTLQFSDNVPRTVSITDATGRLITIQQVAASRNFDISALSSGIYLLSIKNEKAAYTLRIVVQK